MEFFPPNFAFNNLFSLILAKLVSMKKILFAVLCALVLAGCQPRLLPYRETAEFPDELNRRLVLKEAGTWINYFDELPGHLVFVYSKSGGAGEDNLYYLISPESYAKDNAKHRVSDKPLVRYQGLYNPKQDYNSYFYFDPSKLNENNKIEFVITDEDRVIVQDESIPLDKLKNAPIPDNVLKVLYVKGAVLSSVKYRSYYKVPRPTGANSRAFLMDKKIFETNEDYALDYRVGLTYYDITYYFKDNYNPANKGAKISKAIDKNFPEVQVNKPSAGRTQAPATQPQPAKSSTPRNRSGN